MPRTVSTSRNSGRVSVPACILGPWHLCALILWGRPLGQCLLHIKGTKWKALISSKGHVTFFCSYFSFNPSISSFKDKTTGLGSPCQILIKNIYLILPDSLSMDTGKEGIGRGNICHPDRTHAGASHPDTPRAVGLDASMEGTRKKEQLPSKRDQS